MEGKWTDRIFKQKPKHLCRQCSKALRAESHGKSRVIRDALFPKDVKRLLCEFCSMMQKRLWIYGPGCFHSRSKSRHRKSFYADASNASLLTFNNRRTRSAEWIKNGRFGSHSELRQILSHEMRWKRKHEPIPVMYRE